MLTQEKAEALVSFLNEDAARAAKLGTMKPEDAAKALRADGLEITADELAEFAAAAKQASEAEQQSGELDENALEGVSGGANQLLYAFLHTYCMGVYATYKLAHWVKSHNQ